MPRSTVAAVLKRAGLSRLRDLDPPALVRRYEHTAPGDLIHLDIKKLGRFRRIGHRITGNRRQDSPGAGWEYVHVAIDDFSRLAYAEILANEQGETTAGFLRRALIFFSSARNQGQAPAHRQWQRLSLARLHRALPEPVHHAEAHQTLPALHQWKGRTLHSDSS